MAKFLAKIVKFLAKTAKFRAKEAKFPEEKGKFLAKKLGYEQEISKIIHCVIIMINNANFATYGFFSLFPELHGFCAKKCI